MAESDAAGVGGIKSPPKGMDESARRKVTAALMLAMAVVAMEQTVVSPAMPSIIFSLKGLEIYPWVFSAYLLASTVMTPVYGKLADLWGRKKILLGGLALFTVGSVLAGMSASMPGLIAMRVVQGLGAGAVGPVILTMLGDLFTLEERAKVQGWFSAVWGVSSVAGPTLGGYLTEDWSWRCVFYVTVPFAAVAAYVLVRHVHEDIQAARHPRPIDWPGALGLGVGSALLLLAVLLPGASMAQVLGLIGIAAVILGGFIAWENRAPDPILPPDLMTQVPIAAAIAVSFVIGALMFGIDTYIPLYVQGVLGWGPKAGGWIISPMFLSWAISVAVAARVVVRFGFRATAVAGLTMISAGVGGLVLGAHWPRHAIAIFSASLVVIGFGMGPGSLSCILNVQNAVPWNRRGVATGAVTFFRSMGGALGVGFLGATLAFEFSRRLISAHAGDVDIVAALRPETHHLLTADQLRVVQGALGVTLRDVLLQMFALAVVAVFLATRLAPGRATTRVDDAPAESLSLAAIEH
ncbi:MFS transporter [Tundrisphaera sp. TA3]|uniref:MFS transporter n=1 Tax=Tundrisphaera sp. TA3 TaxID=3435775 RepID=UPI003EB997E4